MRFSWLSCARALPSVIACAPIVEDGDAEGIPDECVDADLYRSEPCLEAVMQTCRGHAVEVDCWSAPPMAVRDQTVHCTWTDVVALADPSTCAIESAFGRCEAALPYFDGLMPDPCVDGTFVMPGHVAFLADYELVDIGLSPDGDLFTEPIGPWVVIGSEVGAVVRSCAEGVWPEGPEWCACGPQACAASSD